MKITDINYYSFICSKDDNYKPTAVHLFNYLTDAGIKVKSLIGKNSIFSAYKEGLEKVNPKDDDIIILCHDDIEIMCPPSTLFLHLNKCQSLPECGFIGVAGTRNFDLPCVWWNWDKKYDHSGGVYHGTMLNRYWTNFGPYGEVVVLDGVFLACTGKTLRSIKLEQPEAFSGNWDFYDIYYTFQTHINGKKNYTVPITIRHESPGTPRESWDSNRREFIKMYNEQLPKKVELT
jgi:hypothetical protein